MTTVIQSKTAVRDAIETEYRDCPLIGNITDPTRVLEYEQATHALKYVPNLALRVGTWLVAYREPDELYRIRTGDRVHPFEMQAFLTSDVSVRPVLVEDSE
jgi:hypothetical protein